MLDGTRREDDFVILFEKVCRFCISNLYANILTLFADWEPCIKPRIGQDPWDMKFRFESQTDVENSVAQPRKQQQDETSFTSSDNSALYAADKVDGRDRVGLLISISLDCR